MSRDNPCFRGVLEKRHVEFYLTVTLIILTLFASFGHVFASDIFSDRVHAFAKSPAWRVALHMGKHEESPKSRVDTDAFFVSPQGRSDPVREVKALIDLLNSKKKIDEEPAECHYPFRTKLLREAKLWEGAKADCPKLDYFVDELGENASFVFVSHYMDNPASLMGHILLKFRNEDYTIGQETVRYLDKTLNFAAGIPPGTGVLSYVFRGIFGGFSGQYSVASYADMVELYTNMESRDLYLYPLILSSDQILNIKLHIWELLHRSVFEYYFFDENCAYNLLAIVEAGLPNKNLIEQFGAYSLPVDVVKILARENLVEDVVFEPSLYKRITEKKRVMSFSERRDLDRLESSDRPSEIVDEIQSAHVLETYNDFINFRKSLNHGILSASEIEGQKSALKMRSTMGLIDPRKVDYRVSPPHLGHDAQRLGMSIGNREGTFGRGEFVQIRYRPVIHSLDSRDLGMPPFSSIRFFDFVFETDFTQANESYLRELIFVDVAKHVSSSIDLEMAWEGQFGMKSYGFGDETSSAKPFLHAGLGLSQSLLSQNSYVSIFSIAMMEESIMKTRFGGGSGLKLAYGYQELGSFKVLGSSSFARSIFYENLSLFQASVWRFVDAWRFGLNASHLHYGEASESNLSIAVEVSF